MKLSREFIVGIVFVVAIALFIWGYNYLKGWDVFTKQKSFFGIYNQINGLMKANPVSINGLNVGQVKNLYFEDNHSGRIVVEIVVTSDFPIPVNSIAKIYSSDIMGSKAIEIVLGNSTVIAVAGDTLLTSIEAGLKEEVNRQVQPIKKKAEDLLATIDSAVTVISEIFNENARRNLAQSFESIKNTLEAIQSASYEIDTLVTVERNRLADILTNIESITKNLDKNKDNINNIISNFSAISDTLAKAEIPKTFNNANIALKNIAEIADKINKGEGTIGLLIHNDSLYYQLEKSAADLNKLLEDIRKNPKKYVRFSLF
ncbi:MAG: MCE family protein [Bacteroidales bacterium]|nr:MCE family protein [Bacteroidales bacterium]MCK4407095.1 MCE family protein [Bacteroidales bacterium]